LDFLDRLIIDNISPLIANQLQHHSHIEGIHHTAIDRLDSLDPLIIDNISPLIANQLQHLSQIEGIDHTGIDRLNFLDPPIIDNISPLIVNQLQHHSHIEGIDHTAIEGLDFLDLPRIDRFRLQHHSHIESIRPSSFHGPNCPDLLGNPPRPSAFPYRFLKKLSIVIDSFAATQTLRSKFSPIDSALDLYAGPPSILCHAIDGFQVADGAKATGSATLQFSFPTGIVAQCDFRDCGRFGWRTVSLIIDGTSGVSGSCPRAPWSLT
jgi:hypothetical protein